jgi:peroxiredoxin
MSGARSGVRVVRGVNASVRVSVGPARARVRAIAVFCVCICVCISVCAGGCTGAYPSETPGPSTSRAADFAARDVHGRTVRLSDYLGAQVVLLDFWATYCEPCLAEMPHLEALYEEARDRGFVVLAVAMDGPETVAEVPSFARRNGLTFPVVLDEDSHVASLYDPKKSAPFSVLIDRSGAVVRVREGYNPGDERLVADDVRAALAASARASTRATTGGVQ